MEAGPTGTKATNLVLNPKQFMSGSSTNESRVIRLPSWVSQAAAYAAQLISNDRVPQSLKPWVEMPGSMTQAVADTFSASPTVTVYHSGKTPLLDWERAKLLAPVDHSQGYARHISLDIHDSPVLAARSVTLSDSPVVSLLADLHSKPLARLLFEDDQWQRQGPPTPVADASGIIGRVCVWQDLRSHAHLLVEEFFLFR